MNDIETDSTCTSIGGSFKNKRDAKLDGSAKGSSLCTRERLLEYPKRLFSLKTLKKRVPILTWLPKYSRADLEGDAVAGVTVALTVIPQGLALAILAGLPPQYGLYSAFMGCFVYCIFGSCKDLTIGPTAIMSLMTHEHVHMRGVTGAPVYAVILTFFSGIIQLAMGFFNLGFLVNFIPEPVISGFTSAAAITIAVSQLKSVFGLSFDAEGFIDTVKMLCKHIHETKYGDMAMGLSSVVILLAVRHFKDRKFGADSRVPSVLRKVLEKTWFMFATGRNAVVVLVCAGIAAILSQNGMHYLTLTTGVAGGLPKFSLPAFTYEQETNGTVYTKDLQHILKDIGSGMIIIPLLSILEAIAIGKAFAKGKKLDATQELIALGLCNLMGSFVSSYPTTGSFSRTAINNSSGVRTTVSGVFTGAIVLLALGVLAPYFSYLPSAALAAVIFVSVIFMVHYQDVPLIWRTKKWDLVPFFATFIGSFVIGLEYGILLGVGLSFLFLLFQEARPRVEVSLMTTNEGVSYLYARPDRSVFFPSVEYLKTKINKGIPDDVRHFCVVVDGSNVANADFTMAFGVRNMINSYKKETISTIFLNLQGNVQESIKGANPVDFNYCSSIEEAEQIINKISKECTSSGNGTFKLDLTSTQGVPPEETSNSNHNRNSERNESANSGTEHNNGTLNNHPSDLTDGGDIYHCTDSALLNEEERICHPNEEIRSSKM